MLGAMRFAMDDPDIGPFIEKYDSIPVGDRERLSWEAIAIAAGINIKHLLGAIQVAAQNYSVNTVKLIAVTSHPKITRARVEYGLLPSGERDRTALDTAMGFLPSAKGPTFIGKAVFTGPGSGSPAAAAVVSDDDDTDTDNQLVHFAPDDSLSSIFPSSNAMQEKLIAIRQKLLE